MVANLEDYRIAYRLSGACPGLGAGRCTAGQGGGDVPADRRGGVALLTDGCAGINRPTVIKYCQEAVRAGRLQEVPGDRQKRYAIAEGLPSGALRQVVMIGQARGRRWRWRPCPSPHPACLGHAVMRYEARSVRMVVKLTHDNFNTLRRYVRGGTMTKTRTKHGLSELTTDLLFALAESMMRRRSPPPGRYRHGGMPDSASAS